MKLVLQNILRDKKRTLTILLTVLLMVGVMTSLGNLFYGIRNCQAEYTKSSKGYYEYSYVGESRDLGTIKERSCEIGATQFIATTEVPVPIQLQACDREFLKMNKIHLMKGRLPSNGQEIIAEEWVLLNLGKEADLGHRLLFEGKEYKIVGILQDSFYKKLKEMNVFTTFFSQGECEYYIQFHEKNNLPRQMKALKNKYALEDSKIRANWDVLESEGVKAALGKGNNNFRGWISRIVFDEYDFIMVWSFFAVFMIYSIYYLSLYKREKDYGVLKSLGCSKGGLFFLIFSELFILYLIGFAAGSLLGTAFTARVYRRFLGIFLTSNISIVDFKMNLGVVIRGFAAMTILLLLVTAIIVRRIYKLNTSELIRQKEGRLIKKRKILSRKQNRLIYNISYRFTTIRKTMVLVLLVSLSLSGIIFLTSQYILEEIKKENILKIRSDLGSGMDYRIYVGNTDLLQGISDEDIKNMESLSKIGEVHPYKYTLASLILNNQQYPNEKFFEGENENSRLLEMTGGICTKESDGTYLLRSNLWGYDAKMLESLKEFILDGSIEAEQIEKGQKALVRLPMDGAGGYDNVRIKVGDKIKIKVPKREYYGEDDIFKFKNDQYYETLEIEVAATLKAVSARNEYFIDDWGMDLIVGNDIFTKMTEINCYNQAELKKKGKENQEKTREQLANITAAIKSGYFIDHSLEIEQEEKNYNQKIFIFSLMSIAVMTMSFLYLINSSRYITHIWKRELQIMRVLGLSDRDLYKMMITVAAFYGSLSLVFLCMGTAIGSLAAFYILKKILFFYNASYLIRWDFLLMFGIFNWLICSLVMVSAGKRAIGRKG